MISNRRAYALDITHGARVTRRASLFDNRIEEINMAIHVMSEFVVILDEANDTSFAVDLANAMAKSIDSESDNERSGEQRKAIRLAFNVLCEALLGVHGEDWLASNVVCPNSL